MLKTLLGLSKMPEPKENRPREPDGKGVFLGHDNLTKEPIILTEHELNQHTFLCGTTGSGKTTTILCFVEFAVKNDTPLVVIDGKGDLDFAGILAEIAHGNSRSFQMFSITDPENSYHYNPLSSGGPTELKDRLMDLSEWKEPHYQYMAERYLQLAFTLFEIAYDSFDLPTFIYGLAPENLALIARDIDAPSSIITYLEKINRKGISGLIDRLTVIVESQIGHLFFNESGNTISLPEAIQSKSIILFSLDSLAYPLYSRLLGRLVVNDLKAVASRRKKDDPLVITVYDEFNVFASRNVVDL